MPIKQIIIGLLLLFVFLVNDVCAQTKAPLFLGVQPAVTVEPFYEEGEFDVNLAPIVFEVPIGQRIDFRLLPMLNYHFGESRNGVSDVGFFTVLPVFLKKSDDTAKPFGFYVGPVLGLGRNLLYKHYTTTLAIEPGYLFEAKKSFTISLGLQLGASFFSYDAQSNKSVFHWGPKVSFGFWIDRSK